MLKEQKRLRLEDPILKYLPQQHALEGITILHLLGHTSGIANYTSIPEYNQKLNKLKLTPQEMLQLFVSQPLHLCLALHLPITTQVIICWG